jgi:hypothetical protein
VTDLVQIPQTGELIDVKSATTDRLAEAHDEIKTYTAELRSFARAVDDELIERMDYDGKRTFHGEGFTLESTAPTQRDWDMDRLQIVLARLVREETISQRKADACIRTKLEPVLAELRTLEKDPRCTHAIRECYSEVAANRYVKVRR